ncbi:helix-turn-helix transcriptional regulator [Nostoc sp. FACHB-87]|uniref:helix-turn-helix transcriptional regulator n=1 Tax=Nostocales TaxID=1161 RepID=UPI001684D046|nr:MULTISPECIES: helix-turn-helix transcriptional regulator [Nostocales]MBD2302098.1 helix-turn-helix transcriptional regulator [Nostoc sp. FACHB-190]MBD2457420.1 helix-turn-helix transcriptional regulator [Nostoc sp. FACHB-87]MBD2476619.1 helix-turn-helix transcriptional regulator [Anabaena sp. FACHB-83]MBD2486449.1 helix-turn-helix transcriptional regulator [Aulosira sp. FACHB-615]
MVWDMNLEVNDPEQYIKLLPTISKHIPNAKDYKILWRLAQLENFDLLNVVWQAGSSYTQGYNLPGKIVFTFFEGEHLFKVGSEELLINNQHLCIAQQGLEHIRLKHVSSYSALSIYVDEFRYFSELSKYLDRQIDNPKLVQVFDRTSDYGRSLYQMVLTLWNLIETNGHPIAIKNLELAIFSSLVQGPFYKGSERESDRILVPEKTAKVSEISIARVREAADYIRANLKKNLTIGEIAAAIQCSSRSLQTAFARHYGFSPNEYLRNCRLEAAHVELLTGEKTITSVALEYGFSNTGRFAKYFQQYFGKHPSVILRNVAKCIT